jgi:hypothetical protein
VVHATFQFSGSVGKRHRFREAQLWNDPVEYFDPPQGRGFLSYQPYIPDSLKKKPTTHNPSHLIELHFKLVNYQLSQVLPWVRVRAKLGLGLGLGLGLFPEWPFWNIHLAPQVRVW